MTPQPTTSRLGIIVCERSCRWAPAIRVALKRAEPSLGRPVRLIEVRSVSQCGGWLEEFPQSIVACEIEEPRFADTLSALAGIGRRYAHARIVALAPSDQAGSVCTDWQNAVREVGAVLVVSSPRVLKPLLGIARRLGKSAQSLSP